MTWYKYKDEKPTNGLPTRIRTDDGSTITCLNECSESELKNLGFVIVDDPPYYNENKEEIFYDDNTSTWIVQTTTDPIKLDNGWKQSDFFKDKLKIKLLEEALEYVKGGGTISTYFDSALTIVDNITKQNYSSPFEFDWRYPSSIGYTEDIVVGITSTEYRMINSAFTNFVSQTYIPNQKY
jgi:hypothetical protein